jgi:hypothetical protein
MLPSLAPSCGVKRSIPMGLEGRSVVAFWARASVPVGLLSLVALRKS